MSVTIIDTTELRQMTKLEGLVIQGCGGDLKEWVDGINDLLIKQEILFDNTKFKEENCYAFRFNKCTCLLFPFTSDLKVNMGKLAIWRLATHQQFAGTWLSDYIPNYLGGYLDENRNPIDHEVEMEM